MKRQKRRRRHRQGLRGQLRELQRAVRAFLDDPAELGVCDHDRARVLGLVDRLAVLVPRRPR